MLEIWTLRPWAPGLEKIGLLGFGCMDPKNQNFILPLKVQSLIMIYLIAGFSFLKNEGILARIWKGVKMFLELSTSVKNNISVFNIRVNFKVMRFLLSN